MPASPILTPQGATRPLEARSFKPMVSTLLLGVGVALLIATLIDFGILWIVQHQSNSQWEFAALSTTFDNFSLLLIGLAAVAAGLHLGNAGSLLNQRVLTVIAFLLGLCAALGALLLVTDFFDVRNKVDGVTRDAFYTTMAKSVTLAVIYTITLFVTGIRGLRSR
ncbi:MAG: hypothetical protein ABJD11_14420 [Gemmatimonadota bacterium]